MNEFLSPGRAVIPRILFCPPAQSPEPEELASAAGRHRGDREHFSTDSGNSLSVTRTRIEYVARLVGKIDAAERIARSRSTVIRITGPDPLVGVRLIERNRKAQLVRLVLRLCLV